MQDDDRVTAKGSVSTSPLGDRTHDRLLWWSAARSEMEGLPGGGLNIAHEAIERHARGDRAHQAAVRFLAKDGTWRALSYAELSALSSRFANVVRSLGVGKGEAIFVCTGRTPELYIAAFGALKNGSVFCPLFSSFGPKPLCTRLQIGAGTLLVTTARIYQERIASARGALPMLRHVVLVDEESHRGVDALSLKRLMEAASDRGDIVHTGPKDPALLHFTSGTTGKPKGALHVHGAIIGHHGTAKLALDLHPGDVYWCTADPGWVTGTSYGLIAPLSIGATAIVDEAEFDGERWYRTLQDQEVNVWYTSPTALRMLMNLGTALARRYDLGKLRFVASVGEPLNAELVRWSEGAIGAPCHDTWWQTETGCIMIASLPSRPIKPGAMGQPLPGVEAAVVRRREAGGVDLLEQPGITGELALRKEWPSMFRGYLHDQARYAECFADEWYLSGDLVRRDEDGYFWFVGRADDVIKSSGHLISPFEVESVLLEHPAVAEAAAIGVPDAIATQVVRAFVALKSGFQPSDPLERELRAFARKRLGAVIAPKAIAFCDTIPKTRSGKLLRRVLKARALGSDVSAPE